MANFKIGNTTPAVGNIKAGSTNVIRIMNGDVEVWPPIAATSGIITINNNNTPASGKYITNVSVNGIDIIVGTGAFEAGGFPITGTYVVPGSDPYVILVSDNTTADTAVSITSIEDPTNPFCGIGTGTVSTTQFNLFTGPSLEVTLSVEGNTTC